MKFIYTWHDLGRYAKNAAKSFLTGLIRLLWVIILLVINIIATALICGKNAIKKKPCLSVLTTFVVMLLFIAVVHMRMKVKLTTAEWQRDSLEELQAVVKGNIELVHLPFNMLMVVNEEGALNRSDINIKASLIANTIIYGDVLVCKAEEVK